MSYRTLFWDWSTATMLVLSAIVVTVLALITVDPYKAALSCIALIVAWAGGMIRGKEKVEEFIDEEIAIGLREGDIEAIQSLARALCLMDAGRYHHGQTPWSGTPGYCGTHRQMAADALTIVTGS
jgi:hypothetical protein